MKYKLFSTLCMFWLAVPTLFSQIPTGVPGADESEPIDLTDFADILIYIVLPIIIIALVIIRTKKKKK